MSWIAGQEVGSKWPASCPSPLSRPWRPWPIYGPTLPLHGILSGIGAIYSIISSLFSLVSPGWKLSAAHASSVGQRPPSNGVIGKFVAARTMIQSRPGLLLKRGMSGSAGPGVKRIDGAATACAGGVVCNGRRNDPQVRGSSRGIQDATRLRGGSFEHEETATRTGHPRLHM